MKTLLLSADIENLSLASKLLRDGEVVGIPTETVYGLGADARNGSAVEKIFLAKGRPQDNPLICHISSMEMLSEVVSKIPEDALLLAIEDDFYQDVFKEQYNLKEYNQVFVSICQIFVLMTFCDLHNYEGL